MSTLEKAISLASEAHSGQLDKAGRPYILHSLRLMLKFESEAEMIIAILHDIVEDCDVSLEAIKGHGFSHEIVDAIESITKRDGEAYEDFISRVARNQLATKIKIEDLRDKLNLSRLNELTDRDIKRAKKIPC